MQLKSFENSSTETLTQRSNRNTLVDLTRITEVVVDEVVEGVTQMGEVAEEVEGEEHIRVGGATTMKREATTIRETTTGEEVGEVETLTIITTTIIHLGCRANKLNPMLHRLHNQCHDSLENGQWAVLSSLRTVCIISSPLLVHFHFGIW